MANLVHYLWIIVLIIYIISPWDLSPFFFDDLIALGVVWYLWHKKTRHKREGSYYYSSGQSHKQGKPVPDRNTGLQEAYRLIGTTPDAPWKDIQKAYKAKIVKSHPDKVNHLGEELQEKAREITLKLNQAFDIIKRNKKI